MMMVVLKTARVVKISLHGNVALGAPIKIHVFRRWHMKDTGQSYLYQKNNFIRGNHAFADLRYGEEDLSS